MPRTAGVYSLPPSYEAVAGENIRVEHHNPPLEDLAAALNEPAPVIKGGTGAISAAEARTNLGVQQASANLTSLSGLTLAADKGLYSTGADTLALFDLTAAGRALLGDADAEAQRTTLGLGSAALEDFTDNDDLSVDEGNVPSRGNVAAWVSGRGAPAFVLEEQYVSGTNVLATSGSWLTRVLNTEVLDTLGVVTLSSNQFTVSRDCWVSWSSPFIDILDARTRVYNVTDGAVVAYSDNARAKDTQGYGKTVGGCALSAGKTYQIEYRTDQGRSEGCGAASGFATEIYTRLEGWLT